MQEHYYKFWRDLIKPKAFEVDRDTLREDYGRFMVRPLERGYGVTLGNSLRRILLSSMMGSAVSAVKFDGVLHVHSWHTFMPVHYRSKRRRLAKAPSSLKRVKGPHQREQSLEHLKQTGAGRDHQHRWQQEQEDREHQFHAHLPSAFFRIQAPAFSHENRMRA